MRTSIDLFELLKILLVRKQSNFSEIRSLSDSAKSSNLFMAYRMLAKKWPIEMHILQSVQHSCMIDALYATFSSKTYPQEMYTKTKSEKASIGEPPYLAYDQNVIRLFMRANSLDDEKNLGIVYSLNGDRMLAELENIKNMLQKEKTI